MIMVVLLLQLCAAAAPAARLPAFDRLWDYDRPYQTEARFRALLPAAERAGDRSYTLQLLTQIARCQGIEAQEDHPELFVAAHATLDQVERELPGAGSLPRVRYLLERGRVYNSSNHPAASLPFFKEAWDLARRAKQDPFAIDAAHMVAIAEPDLKDKRQWNQKAINLARRTRDDGWLVSLYNNQGEVYVSLKQYHHALDCFENILKIKQRRKEPPDYFAQIDVARCLRLVGNLPQSMAILRPMVEKINLQGDPEGYLSEQYGEDLLALHRAAEARPYFAKAYAILSHDPWVAASQPERMKRLKAAAGEQGDQE